METINPIEFGAVGSRAGPGPGPGACIFNKSRRHCRVFNPGQKMIYIYEDIAENVNNILTLNYNFFFQRTSRKWKNISCRAGEASPPLPVACSLSDMEWPYLIWAKWNIPSTMPRRGVARPRSVPAESYQIYGIYEIFLGFMGFMRFIWDLWDLWDFFGIYRIYEIFWGFMGFMRFFGIYGIWDLFGDLWDLWDLWDFLGI